MSRIWKWKKIGTYRNQNRIPVWSLVENKGKKELTTARRLAQNSPTTTPLNLSSNVLCSPLSILAAYFFFFFFAPFFRIILHARFVFSMFWHIFVLFFFFFCACVLLYVPLLIYIVICMYIYDVHNINIYFYKCFIL